MFDRRIPKAALGGTAALVAWGMLFWALLYEPAGVYHTLPDDAAVVAALRDSGTTTGTYFHPWPRATEAQMASFLERHRQGPFFKLSYVAEGIDPQSPQKMLFGIFHNYCVALLAACLLGLALPALPLLRQRTLLVFLAGWMGTLFIQVGDPVWFHLPWDFPLGSLIYELGSWALLGLTLGKLMPPTAPLAAATTASS